jgi:ABC-type glycerol-3-phosphate transport system permease component
MAGAVIMLIPFIWMVSTSFKTLDQVFTYPP